MNAFKNRLLVGIAAIVAIAFAALPALAHPLPGRDLLKFAQEPMIATPIQNTTLQTTTYFGHDEFSTAYGINPGPNLLAPDYQGRFMADDFADKITSPVVHLTWWGSYMNNNLIGVPPQAQVQKFLIAFESDLPVGHALNPHPFSIPGQVLQYDVVTLTTNPLVAGSGTFTEAIVPRPIGDPLNEPLFEYNAELHFNRAFPEQADTVYWLKIAALVDLPQGTQIPPIPVPPGTNVTQWGWHNRDYTIQNTLASTAVSPGEMVIGTADTANVWHFQDDAVSGDLRFLPFTVPNPTIFQPPFSFHDEHYVDVNSNGVGLIDGPMGISAYSKDLAFRIYTTQVPEPASCMLMALGMVGLFAARRSSRAV